MPVTLPELSVIVPVKDRHAELLNAVASIASQGIPCELLIVDDGSTIPIEAPINLPDYVKLRMFRHSLSQGPAAARNTGLESARGTWVAFLDSDDVWIPGSLGPRLAAAREAAALNPGELVAWAAGFRYVNAEGNARRERAPYGSADWRLFASGCWFCPGSTAIVPRARMLATVGPQDDSLRRLEDLDWFLRFALVGGRLAVWPGLAADIKPAREHSADLVESAGERLLAKFAARPDIPPRQRKTLLRRLRAYLALERGAVAWHSGRRIKAAVEVARSLAIFPRLSLQIERYWSQTDQLSRRR
ncbi:glycosyltransferase family 2 protein [Bosea sp. 2RAB26]|uniref:glycosyltransferase family 2 protein n=1 Tax=Bosea sp. 2RAB26 TaxID=3237476 RepID=UPI003F9072D4